MCTLTASRLQNFKIRVGNDSENIKKNAICYEQLEPMKSAEARSFTCYQELYGSLVSIDKPDDNLHFMEVRVYGSK